MIKNKCVRCASPIRYFGGKSGLAPTLISLLPAHDKYVEPFGGGGSLLAQKEPSQYEVYNDIDVELVNFFNQAKLNGEQLTEALLSLPTSRYLFERWKNEEFPEDLLDRATRWFFLIRQRIHPSNATLKSGWRAGKHKNLAFDFQNAVKRIPLFSKRLQNVSITNKDFRQVIEENDSPNMVAFIDPPYVEREHYYQGGFTVEDHIELAQMLNNMQGKAIVTYYAHPLIDELYAGWNRIELETFVGSSMLKEGMRRRKEKEVILMNYDIEEKGKQISLF
ncbi:DNA adenine methylase [Viridibacillus arvi]|uniref:DNA adenine methylase n=1 Tax=Viridibacillus arvi TaxID=263475 RepID=UPI0034CEF69A